MAEQNERQKQLIRRRELLLKRKKLLSVPSGSIQDVDAKMSELESKDKPPKDEQHPDLPMWTRFKVKELTNTPEDEQRVLEEAGFEVQRYDGDRIGIKKPNEKEWHSVESSGLELQDITDVGITGILTGVAETAGAVPGAVGGLPGMMLGAGMAAGGVESMRQRAGMLTGGTQEYDLPRVGTATAIGAALPAAEKLAKALYLAGKTKVFPKVAGSASGIKKEIYKYVGDDTPRFNMFKNDEELLKTQAENSGKMVEEAFIGRRKEIGANIEEKIVSSSSEGGVTSIVPGRQVFDDAIVGWEDTAREAAAQAAKAEKQVAQDASTQALAGGASKEVAEEAGKGAQKFAEQSTALSERVNSIRVFRDKYFAGKVKEVSQVETPAEKSIMDTMTGSTPEPTVEQVTKTVTLPTPDEQPLRTVWETKKRLASEGDVSGAMDSIANIKDVDRQEITRLAAMASKRLGDNITEGVPGLKELNQQYSKISRQIKEDIKPNFSNAKQMMDSFSNWSGERKRSMRATLGAVLSPEEMAKVETITNDLVAQKFLDTPSSRAISSQGVTSTSRTVPLETALTTAGGISGWVGGRQLAEGIGMHPYAGAAIGGGIGGFAGKKVGSALGAPSFYEKQLQRMNLLEKAYPSKVRPAAYTGANITGQAVWPRLRKPMLMQDEKEKK